MAPPTPPRLIPVRIRIKQSLLKVIEFSEMRNVIEVSMKS